METISVVEERAAPSAFDVQEVKNHVQPSCLLLVRESLEGIKTKTPCLSARLPAHNIAVNVCRERSVAAGGVVGLKLI